MKGNPTIPDINVRYLSFLKAVFTLHLKDLIKLSIQPMLINN